MRADRLGAGQAGGLAEGGVRGRGGVQFRLLGRRAGLGGTGRTAAAQPAPAPSARFGAGRGRQVDHCRADRLEVGVLMQDLGRDALALPDHAEQDVLGADVVVMQYQGLAQG